MSSCNIASGVTETFVRWFTVEMNIQINNSCKTLAVSCILINITSQTPSVESGVSLQFYVSISKGKSMKVFVQHNKCY